MDKLKVGNAIAYLRKRAGFTQKDLADRIGISDKAVSKWERGLGLPDISYFGKLSILLDTDTDSLLAGDVIHHDMDWAGLMILPQNYHGITVGTIVYDKPMVYYLLSYFMLIGIKKVFVVCSEVDKTYLEREFGDGKVIGMSLCYCGSHKEDVERILDDNKNFTNLMVTYGRTFIYGVDQTRFFRKAMSHRDRVTIMSLPRKAECIEQANEQNIHRHQVLAFNEEREIVASDSEEKLHTQYDYYKIPVLFCPREQLSELTSDSILFDISIETYKRKRIFTEVLDRGYVEMSMEDLNQVLDVSNFVRLVQNACGMRIYCIEEIAWRRGMIGFEQLRNRGKAKQHTPYGRYILSLCERYNMTERE